MSRTRHIAGGQTSTGGNRDLHVEHLYAQAVGFHQQGQLQSAAALYEQILDLQPRHLEALRLLGALEGQTGNHERALQLLNKALKINPAHPAVHNHRGIVLQELKQFEQALLSYNRAIALKADYAEAHNNRGTVHKDLARFDEALASYDRAIALSPDFAEAHNNRGNALKELGQFDASVQSFDRAIAIRADYAEAYNNRGVVMKELNQLDAALQSYDRALASNPRLAEAHFNRGVVFEELKQLDAALESYDHAIALSPNYAEAYANRGVVLKELRRLDAALASFDRAIAINADYAEAHWNKALTLLLCGRFEAGWPLHEWRWKRGGFASAKRNFRQPLWSGSEPLAGKTILLHAEQGLGDTIQFARYAKLVSALGARVVLEVHPSLSALLRGTEGVSEIVARGEALPAFDYHCPLLSLPLAFRTNLRTIPCAQRYVSSAPEKVAAWQERLGATSKPRIGLAWSGAVAHTNDHNRSIALGEVCDMLSAQFEFITLQNEVRDVDRAALAAHPQIRYFGDELKDFADTAALIDLTDIIISVDTSVAHLAGALGKNVWILLPFSPDWRWLIDREDSPWYPSARLFRQAKAGDWGSVITKVKDELAGRNL